MLKERYLVFYILEDLLEKMVFVGGPHQVGKALWPLNCLPGILKMSAFLSVTNGETGCA